MNLPFALMGAAMLVAPWAGANDSALLEQQDSPKITEGEQLSRVEHPAAAATSRGTPSRAREAAPTARPVSLATSRSGSGTISRSAVTSVAHDSSHIVVTADTSPAHFRFTKDTQFLDEEGAALSPDAVKSGTNVTLHFARTEGDLVLTKVIINGHSRPLTGAQAHALTALQHEP